MINLNDSQNIYYNLVWQKHFEGPIVDSDISSDGKAIVVLFGILPRLTTYLLDEKNELIWQNNNLGISAARISPEGKCFAFPDADKTYIYPDFMPVKSLRAIRMFWYIDVSSNCDFISYMDSQTKKIYLRSKDGKELWSSHIDVLSYGSLTISKNADYILASISNRGLSSQTPVVYLFDKNGKLLWDVEKSFGSSSISLNGKYIVGSSDSNLAIYPRNIYEYNTKGDILKKFDVEIPQQTGVEIRKISIADNGVIAAYFSDDNNKIKSSVFLIDIDGQLLWKKEFDSQITAMSMSAYGSRD
jgi:outer membrane protein assembly factor BamB